MAGCSRNKTAKSWTLAFSKSMVSSYRNGSVDGDIRLKTFPVLPVLPGLHSFPLMAVHAFTDVYSIFRFESWHYLSRGISETWNGCLRKHISDSERTLTAQKYQSRIPRQISAIKRMVFTHLKNFLKRTETDSLESALNMDYSKVHCNGILSALF